MAHFVSPNDLYLFLSDKGVPLDLFGSGNAKTVDQLYEEIQSGETKLLYDEGVLIRYFRGVVVHVYSGVYKLHEDRQEFKDGRIRRRNFDFLGEKMVNGEAPVDAALRCIKEEIGIDVSNLEYQRRELKPHADSMSYPGIITIGDLYHFNVTLESSDFNLDGYIEYQDAKTNYYVWRVQRQRLGGLIPEVGIKSSQLVFEDQGGLTMSKCTCSSTNTWHKSNCPKYDRQTSHRADATYNRGDEHPYDFSKYAEGGSKYEGRGGSMG
jgi:hypothetical protein